MNKVSVIISTYGRHFSIIKKAIDSVLHQTLTSFCVYVVNDNHDDSPLTSEIEAGIHEINQQDDRVVFLNYPGNHGACYARNYGAFHSEGEFPAFLDDDDVWHPEKLQTQYDYLNQWDDVAVTCDADYVFVDTDGNITQRKTVVKTQLQQIGYQDVLKENIIGGCSWPMIRQSVFCEVGGFKEGLPSSQDYELWLRLTEKGTVGHIPAVLLDYYIYPNTRISNNYENKIKSYQYIIENYKDKAGNSKEFVSGKYHTLAKLLSHNGYVKPCIRYAYKSFRTKPSLNGALYIPYCAALGTCKKMIGRK